MQMHLNGAPCEVDAPSATPLLWVLRDKLDLTGTKFGCGHGVCGGCIVDVDGAQEHACQVTCNDVVGKSITTIEACQARSRMHCLPLGTRWTCRSAAFVSQRN